ncbi:MAG: beta-lactamase family protein [Dysgonamonadaceae bacterium]|nr:beta-lactamase family protein [Dysgonamonadaceae bacterium]
MKKMTGAIFSIFLLLCACNNTVKDTASLQRSVPEKEGVSSQGIINFLEAIEQSGEEWHSFVFLRHGKVIAEGWWEPYQPKLKQTVYSTSKTFTSTAIGFAVSEKLLSVDDKVISFFPDMLPDTVSPYLAQLSVKDLLSMTAGQNPEPRWINSGKDWVRNFLSVPVVDEPGSTFLYNSMATYMLSAIIQKVTGQRTLDYLQPRLFEPLAIQDAEWEISPEGINSGGWGLRLHTEDMAKLGQLYLQKGKWNGKQILPESWIEEATSAKIIQKPDITPEQRANDDWAQGYCYQIWRCRNNAFRADGAYGQFIIVMPDQDAVIAIQANVNNMQKEINLVWDYLLPAIHDNALPENANAASDLKNKLASLAIAPQKGIDADLQMFKDNETVFSFNGDEQNSQLSILIEGDVCILNQADNMLFFEKEKWLEGTTQKPAPSLIVNEASFSEFPPFTTYGSYCWTDEQTLLLTLKYIETPHTERYEMRFIGDSIYAAISNSMNYNSRIEKCGAKVK